MSVTSECLIREIQALRRVYGQAQRRCTRILRLRQLQMSRMEGELMRTRAQAIIAKTALALAREDAARAVEAARAARPRSRRAASVPQADAMADLEMALRAADLVICQTGCAASGFYWRVEDHCRRTGKACVLVAEPDALRIVSIREEETP